MILNTNFNHSLSLLKAIKAYFILLLRHQKFNFMKYLKILFYTFLFISFGAFAQYGNNMYNRNYGVNRNIGRNYSTPKTTSPAEIEKNKKEQIDKLMEKLKKDLALDELQIIAIRNEIEKNNKNIDIIIKKETSDDEKSKEINSMMERTDIIVKSYLNPIQKEKYKILVEESKNKKSDKKDKKSKKEEINTEEIQTQD